MKVGFSEYVRWSREMSSLQWMERTWMSYDFFGRGFGSGVINMEWGRESAFKLGDVLFIAFCFGCDCRANGIFEVIA